MSQFCTACGATAEPGKMFCMACGAKIEPGEPSMAAVTAHEYQSAQAPPPLPPPPPAPQIQYGGQPAHVQAAQMPMQGPQVYAYAPPAQAGSELIGTLGYIGYLILMSLPVVGLILSIVMGNNKAPSNKRNLARAMIVYNVVGIIIFVVSAVFLYSLLSQLSEVVDFSFSILGFELFK